jgi:hypothetical protein
MKELNYLTTLHTTLRRTLFGGICLKNHPKIFSLSFNLKNLWKYTEKKMKITLEYQTNYWNRINLHWNVYLLVHFSLVVYDFLKRYIPSYQLIYSYISLFWHNQCMRYLFIDSQCSCLQLYLHISND